MRLNPVQLEAFTAVAEARSFHRAARQLCRTQSAVSTQIRKLEETVGSRLFNRQARQVQLTADGELLLGYAHRLLHLDDQAREALNRTAMDGVVRLGMPDDYAHRFLPGVLEHFSRAYPNVRLEVIGALSGPLLDMFEDGSLDVAVITKQPGRQGGEVMRREPLVWAAARHRMTPPINPIPLALFPEGCVFRSIALDALSQHGRDWSVAYSSQSFAGGEIAVNTGHAVTVMLASMVPTGWRILGEQDGFPPLAEAEVELWRHRTPETLAAERLGAYIAEWLPRT